MRLSILLALSLVAGASSAEDRTELDRTNRSFAGHVWLVVSESEGEAFGAVAVARLKDSYVDYAYGLWTEDGVTKVGALEPESLASLEGPSRTVVDVRVAAPAYEKTRHLIYEWIHAEVETSPATQFENLLDRICDQIGLKRPYRSALREADPLGYLRDLARTNRE